MRRRAKITHQGCHGGNRADNRNGRSRQHAQPGRDRTGHEHAHASGDGLRDAADQTQVAHHRPAGHHAGRAEQRPQPADGAAHGAAQKAAHRAADAAEQAAAAGCTGDDAVQDGGLLRTGHAHAAAHHLQHRNQNRMGQRRSGHLRQRLDEDVLQVLHEVREGIGVAREQFLEHRRPGAVGRIRRALEGIGGDAGGRFRFLPIGRDVGARLFEGDALLLQRRLYCRIRQCRFRIRCLFQRIRQPIRRRAHVVHRGLALIDDAFQRTERRVVANLLLDARQQHLGFFLLADRPCSAGSGSDLLLNRLLAVGVGIGQHQPDTSFQLVALFAQRIVFAVQAIEHLLIFGRVEVVDERLPLLRRVADPLVGQLGVFIAHRTQHRHMPIHDRARVRFGFDDALEIWRSAVYLRGECDFR